MCLTAVFCHFLESRRVEKAQRLPLITSATMTFIDIGADAATKVSHILAPHYMVDPISGFFSLFQGGTSSLIFGQQVSVFHLTGGLLQTYGYVLISSAYTHDISIFRDTHPIFGSMQEVVGILFALLAVILQCLSITMAEALSLNVRLTAGELCRANGFVGMTVTSLYHLFVFVTKSEKYMVLISPSKLGVICAVFLIVSGIQQYLAFWLVLNTKAVEYARVIMFSSLLFCGIRHAIYKEDGAAYGFYTIPGIGIIAILIGFLFLSFTAPVMSGPRFESLL
jgi:hypothetical protein